MTCDLDYRIIGPIWPRLPRCALCGTLAAAGTHGGQHNGCRVYRCQKCREVWNEPPKAWHIVWADGSESVVDAIVHDACFPIREPALLSATIRP
jgi:hypothetical protein